MNTPNERRKHNLHVTCYVLLLIVGSAALSTLFLPPGTFAIVPFFITIIIVPILLPLSIVIGFFQKDFFLLALAALSILIPGIIFVPVEMLIIAFIVTLYSLMSLYLYRKRKKRIGFSQKDFFLLALVALSTLIPGIIFVPVETLIIAFIVTLYSLMSLYLYRKRKKRTGNN